jgi:hypothetical protein
MSQAEALERFRAYLHTFDFLSETDVEEMLAFEENLVEVLWRYECAGVIHRYCGNINKS